MSRLFRNLWTKAMALLILFSILSLVSAQFPKRGIVYNEDISISVFGGGEVFWQYSKSPSCKQSFKAQHKLRHCSRGQLQVLSCKDIQKIQANAHLTDWDSDTDLAHSYTEYTPMLWSDTVGYTSRWNANINKWLGAGAMPVAHILGFNEVDNVNQSNLSPQDTAASYLQWITSYRNQATLVSPSVTNGATGIPWMQEFISLCDDCGITIWASHWYDLTSNFANLESYVNEICDLVYPALGKVWLTEFESTPDNPTAQSAFMAQALPFFDDNPCIDRYVSFLKFPT